MITPSVPLRDNTKTIGRNFIYIALEMAITLIGTLLTTVAIARVIGPVRLGYFNLIMWVTNITCSVGSLGIPLTTFKYMGEFLGSGKKELARSVFFYSLQAQTLIASVLTAAGIIAVFTIVAPPYRPYSVLLVLSILPNMITFVPSQANTASENSALNTRGGFVAEIIYVILVALSLLLKWDLIGIAAGVLIYRSVELVVKIVPPLKSMAAVQPVQLPAEIRRRMYRFSGIGTGLMLLQVVVWDRSDILFLKVLQSDIRQVTFFSVCFSVADRLVRIPQAFANALSATQMAEYGRDKDRLFRMTSAAANYVLLGALPILVGVACIAGPFVQVVYGSRYLPAIPVLVVVALFSIPKAILTPAQTLLYSAEDLGYIFCWGAAAGLLDVLLDLILIPGHGAIGAAVANGIAQTFGAVGVWLRVLIRYPVRVDKTRLLKIIGATNAMAFAMLITRFLKFGAITDMIFATFVGATTLLIAGRVMTILQKDDRLRLLALVTLLPPPAQPWVTRLVDFMVPS